jgi:prolipoprotein diacylglyceryltransferase
MFDWIGSLPWLLVVARLVSVGLLLIGMMGAWYWFWRKGNEEHFSEWVVSDALLVSALAGIVGARLGYIIFHWSDIGFSLWHWIDIIHYPGLWFTSGLVVALAAISRFALKHKLDVWEVWDFLALAMSWFFGWWWLSRFVVGGGAGLATKLPWGIIFPQRVEPAHPLALYAAPFYFLLWRYLVWAEPRYRFFLWYRSKKRTARTGFLLAIFLIVSSALQFGLGWLQPPFLVVRHIDVNQVIQGLIFCLGCGLLYVRSGRTISLSNSNKT